MQKRGVGDGIDGHLTDDGCKRDIGTHLGDEFCSDAITRPCAMVDNSLAMGETKLINYQKKTKSWQHASFPSGPPPQYSPRLKSFNFGVRMGSGAFGLVWPTAITYPQFGLIYSNSES